MFSTWIMVAIIVANMLRFYCHIALSNMVLQLREMLDWASPALCNWKRWRMDLQPLPRKLPLQRAMFRKLRRHFSEMAWARMHLIWLNYFALCSCVLKNYGRSSLRRRENYFKRQLSISSANKHGSRYEPFPARDSPELGINAVMSHRASSVPRDWVPEIAANLIEYFSVLRDFLSPVDQLSMLPSTSTSI